MNVQSLDFSFVNSDDVRVVLEDYYRQTQMALSVNCHLGVIVGCGSVAEGLLTWALLRREADAIASSQAIKKQPLRKWNLADLIAVSSDLGLIGPTAVKASWALKDFRNFIHPYNLLQQSARPDEALAMSAIGALSEIRRSLQLRLLASG